MTRILPLLALAAALALPAAPRCSEVQRVVAVLDGQYHDAVCPEGTLRTVAAPALGPARVERVGGERGTPASWWLVDAAGARLRVVRR